MNTKGTLEVVCGSMFSGKTEELMRRLRRADYAKQKTLTIRHQFDTRKSTTAIVSHSGEQRDAHSIANTAAHLDQIPALAADVDIVGIDEVQFFPKEMLAVIQELINAGKRVVCAGLDLDFRGEPFGIIPTLLAVADQVSKLKAICVKCGADAHFTQRLINGEPAKYSDPTIMVGAQECYEARCRSCYSIDEQPGLQLTTPPALEPQVNGNPAYAKASADQGSATDGPQVNG